MHRRVKIVFLTAIFLLSSNGHAKLLDKIAGVINDKVITLSEIERIKSTLPARKEISPFLYSAEQLTHKDILLILQKQFIIKDKLSSFGYVVSDDSVESRITQTEKRLGITRQSLLDFLSNKGISFEEYFEIIRDTMESNIFNSRIIAPLVTITDQEIKDFYMKNSNSSSSVAFNYDVTDFYFSKDSLGNNDIKELTAVMTQYRKSGVIPEKFKNYQTANLGRVDSEGVATDFKIALDNTENNSFSAPVIKGGIIHVFFVQNKEIVESAEFLKVKPQIREIILSQRADVITATWFKKEFQNYFIQENI
jgi:peptidyl-prolyl cis-trans isomerase SurA